MLNKPWYCTLCGKGFCLAAKWSHIGTKQHQKRKLIDELNTKVFTNYIKINND